jgi:hypothetical protein
MTSYCLNFLSAQEASPSANTTLSGTKPVDPVFELKLPPAAVPLNENKSLYLDKNGKRLILQTKVAQNNGLLEMFCCLKQTKEHESILTWDGKAKTLHAGLLALGLEPGEPAKFEPIFVPPVGAELEIKVFWKDKESKFQSALAQEWIRTATRRYFAVKLATFPGEIKLPEDDNLRYEPVEKELLHFGNMKLTDKQRYLNLSTDKNYQAAINDLEKISQPTGLKAKFIFSGSKFLEDPATRQQYYLAEEGDLICVANFSSATIDVNIESSATGESLTYESNADLIPQLGTEVWITIQAQINQIQLNQTQKNETPKNNP